MTNILQNIFTISTNFEKKIFFIIKQKICLMKFFFLFFSYLIRIQQAVWPFYFTNEQAMILLENVYIFLYPSKKKINFK